MGLRTDFERSAVISPDGHETWVRPYPLAIDSDGFEQIAASEAVDAVRARDPAAAA